MQIVVDSPIRYKGIRYEVGAFIDIDDAAVQSLLDAKAVSVVTAPPIQDTPPPEKTVSTRKPKHDASAT
jgi:hypothetical protein